MSSSSKFIKPKSRKVHFACRPFVSRSYARDSKGESSRRIRAVCPAPARFTFATAVQKCPSAMKRPMTGLGYGNIIMALIWCATR